MDLHLHLKTMKHYSFGMIYQIIKILKSTMLLMPTKNHLEQKKLQEPFHLSIKMKENSWLFQN